MKKLCIGLMAVLLVFSFLSFVAAQEDVLLGDMEQPSGGFDYYPGGNCQLFIPHYDVTPAYGWWSGLVLMNMSSLTNGYKIYFCNDNAYFIPAKCIEDALLAFSKKSYLLSYTMCGFNKGWISIESDYPLLGFINYGQNLSTGTSVTTLGPFYSNCQ